MKAYALNILAAISQVINAIIGGDPNVTISARCHRGRDRYPWKVLRWVINKSFWFEEDHCKASYVRDQEFCQRLAARTV